MVGKTLQQFHAYIMRSSELYILYRYSKPQENCNIKVLNL